MKNIKDVLPLLAEPRNIFITMHHKPDGDALGATLALYHFLIQCGHKPTVVSPSEVPDFLAWMPGIDKVLNYEAEPKQCAAVLAAADFIFCLDFNRLDRIKSMEPLLRSAGQPKILIDHHLQPELEAFAYGTSQPEKSSTCEMVYDFILSANGAEKINIPVAQCLYTGVMTDTGSFRFAITTASVHEMLAFLKRRGLEHSIIHQHIYDSWSANRIKFMGYLLYRKMEIFPQQGVGLITLTLEEQQRFKVATGDTEGIVNYPLSIAGINMAIMLTEKKDEVRMSFRSKGDIDVATFAGTYFNGGGHFNAAGGRSNLGLEQTLSQLKELLHLSQ
ncbi:MAG: bifunctional oligoribonuclease/PAP phosphatase NrnA [Edaphocola sp.]